MSVLLGIDATKGEVLGIDKQPGAAGGVLWINEVYYTDSLPFGTKVDILATKVRRFFSIFILIPITYIRSIVPPPPTVSRKQNMARKGQYFFVSRAWDTQWVCNMG